MEKMLIPINRVNDPITVITETITELFTMISFLKYSGMAVPCPCITRIGVEQ